MRQLLHAAEIKKGEANLQVPPAVPTQVPLCLQAGWPQQQADSVNASPGLWEHARHSHVRLSHGEPQPEPCGQQDMLPPQSHPALAGAAKLPAAQQGAELPQTSTQEPTFTAAQTNTNPESCWPTRLAVSWHPSKPQHLVQGPFLGQGRKVPYLYSLPVFTSGCSSLPSLSSRPTLLPGLLHSHLPPWHSHTSMVGKALLQPCL